MKNALFSVWVFLVRFFSYCHLRFGIFKYWSLFYRFIWEQKFKNVPIRVFASLNDVVTFIGGGDRWRADSWRTLGDAVSSPERVQQIFAGVEPQPESEFDCDDFMSFTVAAIDKSIKVGLMTEITSVKGLVVTWIVKDTWVSAGHAVTLLEYKQRTDGSTWYSYMDYEGPSPKCPNIDAVAEMIRTKYVGKDKTVQLCWCAFKADLTPWISKWG